MHQASICFSNKWAKQALIRKQNRKNFVNLVTLAQAMANKAKVFHISSDIRKQ